ncbi:cobalamin-dependent protein [Streptomyces albidoflavus]|uniref:cobalamin B12-binding domain-containing protein n=1 Tax=Streptomyces TaxID=1883 RepID=UPI00063EA3EE|nr:cobalamin-dependent protein [Streptomyces sp. KE1]KLJ01160.1 methylaspartate mutase [Streptomyces sp. KE1]
MHTVVTTTSSDAHTWNLIYLELLLREWGHEVLNLGACVPDALVVDTCVEYRPDLLVVSSVNGHGANDGLRLIQRVRATEELADTPVVIGGKLGTADDAATWAPRLRQAGFDAVFDDSGGILPFRGYLDRLTAGARV